MIVDSHVHVWGSRDWLPESYWTGFRDMVCKAANMPIAVFEEKIYPKIWDPTGEKFIAEMDDAGVDAAVMMPLDYGYVLGDPRLDIFSQNRAHAEIVAKYPDRLYTFVGIDPRRPGAATFVRQAAKEWNARGVKLYPPCGFYPGDDICRPVYEAAVEQSIPVLFHTGPVAFPLKSKFAQPVYLDEVAADYPDLTIIMAHSGFNWWTEAVEIANRKGNIILEVSGWQERVLPEEQFVRDLAFMRDNIGANRILVASDRVGLRGHVRLADWFAIFKDLPAKGEKYGLAFKPEEVAQITGGNARRIMRL